MLNIQTEPVREPQPDFPVHLEESLRQVRGALTELLASVGADPAAPQVVSRRFRINKNLAWKVSKVVNATDLVGVAPHVPRPAGARILLEALARGGAPAEVVARAREALGAYEAMVRLHAGDRASLELLLSSLMPDRVDSKSLEAARKLAFQGNSAIWGVQARAQLTLQVLHPSSDPERVSSATVQGFVDFRRLRPSATWPLARFQVLHVDGTPGRALDRPLDPASVASGGPPIMHDYCTGSLPEIREVAIEGGTELVLGEGPVGNTATANCLTAVVAEGFAPRHAAESDMHASLWTNLHTPVEALQYDLLLHRDLGFGTPTAHLLSAMETAHEPQLQWNEDDTLPLTERVERLGAGPPVMASPLFPRYHELAADAVRYAGHDPEQYEGWRFVLRYPPIPTRAVLRFSLPQAPG